MKRLLIGASTVALAIGVITTVSPSASAQEGELMIATHSDLALNRGAVEFLRFVTAIPGSDVGLLGSYSPEDQQIIGDFVRNSVIAGEADQLEQARLIHQWIATQVRYAGNDEVSALTPREVLDTRVARGRGFSVLYKAMLDAAGIPNVLVGGMTAAGSHQWNIVSINDEFFHSDAAMGIDYFKKDLKDFSADHAVIRLYGVTMADGPFHYEYNHGISLVGVTDPQYAQSLVVPERAHGLPVVRVSSEALSAEGLSGLVIPATVGAIDVRSGTGNVTCFTVLEGNPLLSAESCALFSADKTRLIAYPKKAEAHSFALPAQTIALDESTAFDAPALQALEVSADNHAYASYAGALYTKDYSSLRVIPGGMTQLVVNAATSIEPGVIAEHNALEGITLENGVTTIPARAFDTLPALRVVEFPASVSAIDPGAFAGIDPGAVTLVGQKNSPVEHFARTHAFPFQERSTHGPAVPDGNAPTPEPQGSQPPVAPQSPVEPAPPASPQPPSPPVQPAPPASPAPPQPPVPADPPVAPAPPVDIPPSPPTTDPALPPADGHSPEGEGSQPPSGGQNPGTEPPSGEAGHQSGDSENSADGTSDQTSEGQLDKDGQKDAADKDTADKDKADKDKPQADAEKSDKTTNAAGLEKIGLTTDVTLSPGATMTVVASGYASNEVVTFVINAGSQTMGLVRADALGIAKVTWTIPSDFTPGDHTVVAIGTTGKTLSMPVTVAPFPDLKKSPVSAVKPRQSELRGVDLLAQTGTHTLAKIFAIGAILMGVAATAFAWRRRQDESAL